MGRLELEFLIEVIGWEDGCKNLVGIGSESKKSSIVSTVGLFELELVSNTVWIESSELMCGELDEKFGPKKRTGEDLSTEMITRDCCRWKLEE